MIPGVEGVIEGQAIGSHDHFRIDAGYTTGEIMDALTEENLKFVGRLRGNPSSMRWRHRISSVVPVIHRGEATN